jgi:hypothetical protein
VLQLTVCTDARVHALCYVLLSHTQAANDLEALVKHAKLAALRTAHEEDLSEFERYMMLH